MKEMARDLTSSAAAFPASPKDLLRSPVFSQLWYYAMELLPGVVTPGYRHLNFGLTRTLLSRIDVRNRSILDIGTMEGGVPVLANRQGARNIVGIDVAPFQDKVDAVKHYTGAEFDYYFGLTHGATPAFLKQRGHANFDVVVLSGVLYHCFGPLHTLAMARSMIRTGGLMIVETFATADQEQGMFFNTDGRFTTDPSTYFLITAPLLDYLLRYFKLQPIDCIYGMPAEIGPHKTMRIATVCRAVNDVVAGNDWMRQAATIVDYVTLIDWDGIDKSEGDPVPYRNELGTVDLFYTVTTKQPHDLRPEDAIIKLADTA